MQKAGVILYTQTEVLLRNQTLFHCLFHCIAQNFHYEQDSNALRRHVRRLCYKCIWAPACTLNRSSVLQWYKHGNMKYVTDCWFLLGTASWAYVAEITSLIQAGQPYSLIPRLSCMGKSLETRLGSCSCCICSPFLLWANCTWIRQP